MGMTAHPKRGKREHTGSFWATVSSPLPPDAPPGRRSG